MVTKRTKLVSDEELEQFKQWEKQLFQEASFYNDNPDVDAGRIGERQARIFEDRFEDWEQNAIDGQGPGPRIALGDVKKDRASTF